MKDFLTIGDVSPWGEECVQVSKDWDYLPAMQDQCNKYMEMLQHRFKNIINQTGVYLRQRANSHDFGTYLSIEVVFDDDNKDQVKAALFMEKNMPEFWNDDKVFDWPRRRSNNDICETY